MMTEKEILHLLEKELVTLSQKAENTNIKIISSKHERKQNNLNELFTIKHNNKSYYLNFSHDLTKTIERITEENNNNLYQADRKKIWVKEIGISNNSFDIQFTLNNQNLEQFDSSIIIKENYKMHAGQQINKQLIKDKMLQHGFNLDDIITIIPLNTKDRNWSFIFQNILDWIEKRIAVKRHFDPNK